LIFFDGNFQKIILNKNNKPFVVKTYIIGLIFLIFLVLRTTYFFFLGLNNPSCANEATSLPSLVKIFPFDKPLAP